MKTENTEVKVETADTKVETAEKQPETEVKPEAKVVDTEKPQETSEKQPEQPDMVSVAALKEVYGMLKGTPEVKEAPKVEVTEAGKEAPKVEETEEKKEAPEADDRLQKVTEILRTQMIVTAQVPEALKPLLPKDVDQLSDYLESDAYKGAVKALTAASAVAPVEKAKGEKSDNADTKGDTKVKRTFKNISSDDLKLFDGIQL